MSGCGWRTLDRGGWILDELSKQEYDAMVEAYEHDYDAYGCEHDVLELPCPRCPKYYAGHDGKEMLTDDLGHPHSAKCTRCGYLFDLDSPRW